MKTRNSLFLFVALCAVAALYSCSGGMNPAKLFVKKWQLDSFKSKAFDDQMAMIQKVVDTTKDSMTRAMYKQQLDGAPKQMEEMKKTILTSNLDGTFEMSMSRMGQTQSFKGKWALTADGKRVVMTDDNNPKGDTLNIQELTSDKMTVTVPDGKGGLVYITYKAI